MQDYVQEIATEEVSNQLALKATYLTLNLMKEIFESAIETDEETP